MHDEVGAEFDRPRGDRRRERRIDDNQRAVLVRQCADRADVGNVQQRVRRRLDPHDARLVAHGRSDVGGIGHVDRRHFDVEARQRVPRDLRGARVVRIAHDDVIAFGQQCEQHARTGRHAGRECNTGLGSLEYRQLFLEHVGRRVRPARVDVRRIRIDVVGREAHLAIDAEGARHHEVGGRRGAALVLLFAGVNGLGLDAPCPDV